jgi:hypothetical protein
MERKELLDWMHENKNEFNGTIEVKKSYEDETSLLRFTHKNKSKSGLTIHSTQGLKDVGVRQFIDTVVGPDQHYVGLSKTQKRELIKTIYRSIDNLNSKIFRTLASKMSNENGIKNNIENGLNFTTKDDVLIMQNGNEDSFLTSGDLSANDIKILEKAGFEFLRYGLWVSKIDWFLVRKIVQKGERLVFSDEKWLEYKNGIVEDMLGV